MKMRQLESDLIHNTLWRHYFQKEESTTRRKHMTHGFMYIYIGSRAYILMEKREEKRRRSEII